MRRRRIYTEDVKKKAKELKKALPGLSIYIDGRRQSVYVNHIFFSFEEFMSLDLNIIKHPSFWGLK